MKKEIYQLKNWFSTNQHSIVAFSAGVDSSLVAFLSREFLGREKTLAVISQSRSLKRVDLNLGISFCENYDIPLEIIETQELALPEYRKNPTNRCYFCKSTLYRDLTQLARKKGYKTILNGQNSDDLKDYRPGIQAAKEFSIRSPLSECKLDKLRVRQLAKYLKLDCWNKPATPCLSSRIPYGLEVDETKLDQIERGEAFIQNLGFPIVRLRHYGKAAKIEVPEAQIPTLHSLKHLLEPMLLDLGFTEVEIDSEGFRSGKLNQGVV